MHVFLVIFLIFGLSPAATTFNILNLIFLMLLAFLVSNEFIAKPSSAVESIRFIFQMYCQERDCLFQRAVKQINESDIDQWMIDKLNLKTKKSILDLGCGDGKQIFAIYAHLKKKNKKKKIKIVGVDEHKKLVKNANLKILNKNIEFKVGNFDRRLPFKNNSFDLVISSFAIYYASNINKTLMEAYRVLKPGGRFMCLEFSKIDNELLNFLYKNYSKAIPTLGKYIVGSSKPYEYLISSIDAFYNQEQLLELLSKNGFTNVEYRNLSNGISAIHSGWKI